MLLHIAKQGRHVTTRIFINKHQGGTAIDGGKKLLCGGIKTDRRVLQNTLLIFTVSGLLPIGQVQHASMRHPHAFGHARASRCVEDINQIICVWQTSVFLYIKG